MKYNLKAYIFINAQLLVRVYSNKNSTRISLRTRKRGEVKVVKLGYSGLT